MSQPTTDILTLRAADWERIERETVQKIRLLRELVHRLEPTPLNDKIGIDLVLPAIRLLGDFCLSVSIEDETPSCEAVFDHFADVGKMVEALALISDQLTRANHLLDWGAQTAAGMISREVK